MLRAAVVGAMPTSVGWAANFASLRVLCALASAGWTGAAHVVALGPVRIEHRLDEVAPERAKRINQAVTVGAADSLAIQGRVGDGHAELRKVPARRVSMNRNAAFCQHRQHERPKLNGSFAFELTARSSQTAFPK